MIRDRRQVMKTLAAPIVLVAAGAHEASAAPMEPSTTVSIEGNAFHINGKPTYPGRFSRAARWKASCSRPGW